MHLLPLCVTLSGLLPAIIASQLSNRSNITSQSLPSDGTFWHLDQLDGVMDNKYSYPEQAGEGVDIYVIDSGIYTAHEVFAGRASVIANFVSTEANDDLAGHGTRVAGIAAMVAKKAKVIGIKVLDSNAAVYYPTNETNLPSSWIQGIRFAIQQIMESKRPSVINMSINSGQKDDVDAAVREAAKSKIPIVVSAGNQGIDACTRSPNKVSSVITVANVRKDKTIAGSSNFGSCVDIAAPGTQVLTAGTNSTTGYVMDTGTSMAAPMVSGILAILISMGIPASDLGQKLRTLTKTTIVGELPPGTPPWIASLELVG